MVFSSTCIRISVLNFFAWWWIQASAIQQIYLPLNDVSPYFVTSDLGQVTIIAEHYKIREELDTDIINLKAFEVRKFIMRFHE